MDLKKLVPWNWFRKEDEHRPSPSLPVSRGAQPHSGDPVVRFHQEVDRLFDHFFRGFSLPSMGFGREAAPMAQPDWLKPHLDVAATEKEYTISAELPGVDEKDVQIELLEDTLVIRGEKRQEKEEKEKSYYRVERSYGSFQRTLSLPEDADSSGIGAAYRNGLLTITIPRKSKPGAAAKQIPIRNE
ncbi:MAG: Hsp20/alpha crystallin family protein [Syntrophobacteraceae bacterium]|nr:Hsp20/alpha crystallin family protein [Desulfobacteraceae bacterium]